MALYIEHVKYLYSCDPSIQETSGVRLYSVQKRYISNPTLTSSSKYSYIYNTIYHTTLFPLYLNKNKQTK